MHVVCAGGPFESPIWPSRDFADRDRLLQATIGTQAAPEILIPWVLTYVIPGVLPDLGKDSGAFVTAAEALGVQVDAKNLENMRRQGFPEVSANRAKFLIVSEPKQSIAGVELKWGASFELVYHPAPGVVLRGSPWL